MNRKLFLRNATKPCSKEHRTPRACFYVTVDRNKLWIGLVKGVEAPSWTDLVMQVAELMRSDPQTATIQIASPGEAVLRDFLY